MNWQDYISIDPEIVCGKPVIAGTRLTVEFVLEFLSQSTEDKLLAEYPGLSHQDVQACLSFALENLRETEYYPIFKAS